MAQKRKGKRKGKEKSRTEEEREGSEDSKRQRECFSPGVLHPVVLT